ncbi:HD domain-containing protein [Dendrosporobacter sp. 1207_IL3150]|uniref:HD domain-containing protein n=1 Tax=Dendrosporobacter sp. 1207_IL3150 TaxID=3084054 RepID=UPI002FD9A241
MGEIRDKAWRILKKHVSNDSLIKHCLAVEIAMGAYAEKFGENREHWGAVGLLHDVDFEKYPEHHPYHTRELLETEGYDEEFVNNIESHDRNWMSDRTLLQKTLLAVDELTGFIIACALVRPDKSLDNLEVKSVMKKMKDKAFAKAVNRETIYTSAEAMGVDLREHIQFVIKALSDAAKHPDYQEVPII